MITDPKYFITPFGASGTRLAIPGTTQPDGSVSYPDGFGADYAKELGVDPDAKAMPRDSFNELIYETQNSLAALQQYAYPQWISASMNGGSAFSYLKKARVHYTADSGVTWEVYESLIDSNTATPGTDATKWAVVPSTGTVTIPTISSGGTANAITATFVPALTSLATPFLVLVRASAANSTGTPTINFNGLGALTLYKGANQNLVAGDIAGVGHWMLIANDPSLGKAQLLNPATTAGLINLASQVTGTLPTTSGGTGQITPIASLDALTVSGANIASASTTNIAAATGASVTITGTTTINAFVSAGIGAIRVLTFNGALTLTHNATSLILPGAANITTAAGDVAIMLSLGSGNWKCINYTKYATLPLYNGLNFITTHTVSGTEASFELTGVPSIANGVKLVVTGLSPDGGSSDAAIQLGGASYVTTGYKGVCRETGGTNSPWSTSATVYLNQSGNTETGYGNIDLLRQGTSNTWVITSSLYDDQVGNSIHQGCGSVNVAAALAKIKFLLNGSGNFDGGIVSAFWY